MSPQTSFVRTEDPRRETEWVEIIEPKSKNRIYANFDTGICAKCPPEGVTVRKTEDFSDHWWELYDQKTGKYYYYNPEKQKTAWIRPKESSNSNVNGDRKRLLIIPVYKLQTFTKFASNDCPTVEKCDASTQTIVSNLVSVGTQTLSESEFEKELNDKVQCLNISKESSKNNSFMRTNSSNKSHLNHRQLSEFKSDREVPLSRIDNDVSKAYRKSLSMDQNSSSQKTRVNKATEEADTSNESDYVSYFGPPSSYQRTRAPISIQSPAKTVNRFRIEDLHSSTSTFGHTSRRTEANPSKTPHQMTTNNLSHYLVREARAMGIALISDDENDEDDAESDDDCAVEEDEDTDMRDDSSSHRGPSDLNASQDLGEDSSEGWKSFSDHESPSATANKLPPKSPLTCETSSFRFKTFIDEGANPTSRLSQQLDHQKLISNFRKSRQTSALGYQDSVQRSNKLDSIHGLHRTKATDDAYFNHDQPLDKQLRQLSTLSTLPRPRRDTKDKIALSKPDQSSGILDADYDIVEENCGYYSDSERAQVELSSSAKVSAKTTPGGQYRSPASHFDRNKSSRGSTFSVESFARENLSRHPKGGLLFNRKVKWSRMISWTKSSIRQPMISSVSSDLNSDSIASFKLIQQYMGDRKVASTKKYRQIMAERTLEGQKDLKGKTNSQPVIMSSSLSNSGVSPCIPDRLRDEFAYELAVKGCAKSALRDEIFVQLARQLTENPNQDSVSWGLVLMSTLLSYFSPSSKFAPCLLTFLENHPHQMARDVCQPRLEKRLRQTSLTYCRKPADGAEISIVRLSITKWPQYCGIFGESLERIMTLQACSPYLKTLRLPWILTSLGDKLLDTGGAETEGIFRCAADHDLISQLRLEIDCVDFRKITDAKQVHSLLSNVQDPHVIAGLLKLFFRQLQEPAFPTQLYDTCLQNGHDGQLSCRIFNERLPNLNKDVIAYLMRLLQLLSQNETVLHTKMDSSNLSMVWAPNLLRAANQELFDPNVSISGSKWSIANGSGEDCNQTNMAQSQSNIFEQTRQEMQFIKALIMHLDTSFIENVI